MAKKKHPGEWKWGEKQMYFWGHSLGQLKQYVVGEKEGSPASQPVWELRKTERPSLTSLGMPGTLHQWAPALTNPNATGIQIVTEITDSGGAGETRGQERERQSKMDGHGWILISRVIPPDFNNSWATWPGATRCQCFEGRDTAQTSCEPGLWVHGGKQTVSKVLQRLFFLQKSNACCCDCLMILQPTQVDNTWVVKWPLCWNLLFRLGCHPTANKKSNGFHLD